MSLDVPQSTLKRDHDSFIEKGVTVGDATTASLFLGENFRAEMATASTAPVFSVVTSVSPRTSSTAENSAPYQSPYKKTKLSERGLKKDPGDTTSVGKNEEKIRKEKEREIERQRKEAERKRKEAEREEKRANLEIEKQARDEKRRKIEEEKKRKEEERQKKERSQLRLGSFFAAPSSNKPREGLSNVKAQSSLNSASPNIDVKVDTPQAIEKPIQPLSPYSKLFPDFFIQNGVTLAPSKRFKLDQISIKQAQDNIDQCINSGQLLEKPPKICETLNLLSKNRLPRGRVNRSTRQIIEDFYHGTPNKKNVFSPYHSNEQIFKSVPVKSLKFHEDVRPPYIGTYSNQPIHGIAKLARNPLRKDLPNVDYDYDSEAEWVEDEEGEDLQSDDEEDDVDDTEDIDGFLDDENDENPRSRQFDLTGDLEPISTGLCWEDCNAGNSHTSLEIYRIEFILGGLYLIVSFEFSQGKLIFFKDPKMTSINPFSTSYWTPIVISDSKPNNLNILSAKNQNQPSIQNSAPLKIDRLLSLSATTDQFYIPHQVALMPRPRNKENLHHSSLKLIAPEDMEEFKTAVAGSDLSKIGLIEVLKKKFPGRSAATIKSTLELVARRGQKGQKKAEKRWTLL
ncbi:Chromatin assembly factor 1 subunit rlf2 [Erysiphe neolycopersici]|uniref:Chromatin assembly factor 1 subunit rlf2 n=1 Tax=Erysiphe neolycopersici TaxID=212602 RepID=A0A420HIT9_9PEZI|nr:Chromatin assembly factor 1 subunit rlf2 [Erysiphe neolycopersici]